MQPLGNKLLLPRGPSEPPILAHVIQTAAAVAKTVYVAYSSLTIKHHIQRDVPSTVQWVLDKHPFDGPLQATANVLETLDNSDNHQIRNFLLIAGDVPGITHNVLTSCMDALQKSPADGVAHVFAGHIQPLLACYRDAARQTFMTAAAANEQRLMAAVKTLWMEPVRLDKPLPEWHLRPVHTPEDYDTWLTWRNAFETS